jgi:predicted RNA binding protein YcfA (HicA-like mRNA interferase family)
VDRRSNRTAGECLPTVKIQGCAGESAGACTPGFCGSSRTRRGWPGSSQHLIQSCVSRWRSIKASRLLSALLRIGWRMKRQSGSHRTMSREGWPDFVFAFHDGEEIGPRMLAHIAKRRASSRRSLKHLVFRFPRLSSHMIRPFQLSLTPCRIAVPHSFQTGLFGSNPNSSDVLVIINCIHRL